MTKGWIHSYEEILQKYKQIVNLKFAHVTRKLMDLFIYQLLEADLYGIHISDEKVSGSLMTDFQWLPER